ncbi:C40 family peptidase [Liquorilactobacillus uvarum]|uniref:C40 family peptidase n=1 Tax=Liquorilactobacillus uvarum TaxID=303240 RepID=UPI00070E96DA|nr:C40 family peptidase [Liquorilactobacillus uvarum]
MKRTTKTLLASTVGAAGLFLASTTNASASTTVKVNQNDTVWALSQKYGVSIKSIETLNHIDQNNHLILVNQSLSIPNKEANTKTASSSNTQSTSSTSVVKVTSGDSLWKIAKSYNITVEQLRTLNDLSSDETLILPGQELKVTGTPKATTTTKAADTTSNTASTATSQNTQSSTAASTQQTTQVTVSANHVTYTVKAGDSLYTVAQAYGVSVDSLRASNNLGSTLTIGQTLTINDPTKTPAAQTSSSASSAASSSETASSAATTQATQQSSSSVAQSSSSASSAASSSETASSVATTQATQQSSSSAAQTSSSTAQQTTTTQAAPTSNNNAASYSSQSTTASSAATTTNTASSAATTQSTAVKTVASGSISSIATQIASMGIPYVNGGTTLSGFDCSGFTQYVYAKAGISIPRTSQAQSAIGTYESVSNAQVGDLLFWGGRGSAYHVGIYLGGSSYAAAPEEGENVSVKSFTYYQPSFAVHVN